MPFFHNDRRCLSLCFNTNPPGPPLPFSIHRTTLSVSHRLSLTACADCPLFSARWSFYFYFLLPLPYADRPSLPPHRLCALFRAFLSQQLLLPISAFQRESPTPAFDTPDNPVGVPLFVTCHLHQLSPFFSTLVILLLFSASFALR